MLVGLLMCVPATAQAQVWWDFIESLSGPGPFTGFGLYYRIACGTADTWVQRSQLQWNCADDHGDNIRQIIEARVMYAWTVKDRPVLLADPGDTRKVTLVKTDVTAALRVSPLLDVGAGGGYMAFTADGMDPVHRVNLIPVSLTYTPLGSPLGPKGRTSSDWRRFLRIRLEVNYIPYGFTGADWGKPNVGIDQYATDGNWVLAGGVLFDGVSVPW
jgi:hypothetical protein